jgi:carbon starvation protein
VKLGFFAQRARCADALDRGEVLPPAKTLDEMSTVITNTTVQGTLAAFFAILIVIIILDAARVCWKAIRTHRELPTTETPFVESKIVAGSGLFPSAEERAQLVGAGVGSRDESEEPPERR